jgi:hypothetical protein
MPAVNSNGRQGGFALRTQLALPGFAYLGRNSDPLSACPPGAWLSQFLPNLGVCSWDISSDRNWRVGIRYFHQNPSVVVVRTLAGSKV